jgi:hypothetical protein
MFPNGIEAESPSVQFYFYKTGTNKKKRGVKKTSMGGLDERN